MPTPASLLHAPKPARRHRRLRAWRLGQGLLVGGAAGAGLCLVPAVHTLTGPLQRWAGGQAWPSLWAHSPQTTAGLAVSGLVLSLLALRAGRALLGPAPTAEGAAQPVTDTPSANAFAAAGAAAGTDGAVAAACLAQSPVPLLLLQAPPSAQVLQMNLALRRLLGLPAPTHPAHASNAPGNPAPAWPATGLHRWLSPADGAAFSALLQQLQACDAPAAPRTLQLLRPGQPPLAVDLQAAVVRAADGLPLHTVVQIVLQTRPAARPQQVVAAPATHQVPPVPPAATGHNERTGRMPHETHDPRPTATLQPD